VTALSHARVGPDKAWLPCLDISSDNSSHAVGLCAEETCAITSTCCFCRFGGLESRPMHPSTWRSVVKPSLRDPCHYIIIIIIIKPETTRAVP
jgi:hypothetical protein